MNRGAIETKLAIERRGLSVNKAAELLEYDSGTLSKILREEDGRRPGLALALRIYDEFGVAPKLWGVVAHELVNPDQPAKPAA